MTMKRILYFISILIVTCMTAQKSQGQTPVKNYEKEWKLVDSWMEKRLPASALTEVKKIYALAKKENQQAQVIKALAYQLTLQGENREDNELIGIKEVEAELATARPVSRQILSSLAADLYLAYFNRHRWQLYNRTGTSYKPEDIATWSAEQLHDRIGKLFLFSVDDKTALQKITLKDYDALLFKGNMRHLRPTMFDLLAHRALDYFRNDERSITKPAYAFEISTASAFDPAADFIHRKFETKDTASLHHKALLLYQQLVAFHLNDAKPDALIDVDLQRIQFVYSNSVHPEKETYYFNAVNHIAHQYNTTPAAAQAWYLVAAFHEQNAATYSALGDTTHRLERVKARGILEQILSQKDSSEGKVNAYNLLNQVNAPSLDFRVENVNLPGQPFRIRIAYRNLSKVYLRVVKADKKLKESLKEIYQEKSWPSLVGTAAVRSWEQALPLTNDLQEHAVEIRADALPVGEYILLASSGEKMTDTKLLVNAGLFYVSSISFVNRGDDYFVLNRDNGQPLNAASVQVWQEKYNYDTYKYSTIKEAVYKTDVNGHFKMAKPVREGKNNYRADNLKLEISFNGDRLYMDDQVSRVYYSRDEEQEEVIQPKVFLFLDRGLYRPGQTVYYKGILLRKRKGGPGSDIVSGHKTTVLLKDVNDETIDSTIVTSNEFGSFNGRFTIPAGGLTGNFTIVTTDPSGSADFKVEEYKRPKYEVSFKPLTGTYKVNDKITLTGKATAYAGNAIDGAKVVYRVRRNARYIYPWLYRGWYPSSESMEITHGEATTGAGGEFEISFDALPDLSVSRKLDPVFDYSVTVDVTDGAGETRSAEQTVTVGYKSLFLKNDLPASLPADSLKTLAVRAENSNGELQPTTARVTITRLEEEKRLIRSRLWERADQFAMSKEMYVQSFPNDEYDQETDPAGWKKLEKVFEQTDSITGQKPFPLGKTSFAPGWYLIEIVTNDKEGAEVKDIHYIQLLDSKEMAPSGYLWTQAPGNIRPGEKTIVGLGTAADKVFVVQQVERVSYDSATARNVSSFSVFQMDRGRKNIPVSADEKDRGGFGMSWVFAKHNRIFSYSKDINVPWDNKELKIEYASFRDKTLPGSEEKWKLKISGNNNESVAAEVLASMYDASLDQFYTFNWNRPSIWENFRSGIGWDGSANFTEVNANTRPLRGGDYRRLEKDYDMLTFGIDGVAVPGGGYSKGKKEMRFTTARIEEVERSASLSVAAAPSVAMDQDGFLENMRVKMVTIQASDSIAIAQDPSAGVQSQSSDPVQIRKNFNETAFFFPELRTDKEGNLEFSFTMPEALTKWKFQALAFTKDLASGLSSREIVTQKELMVQPNPTRFLRQGDKMEFSSKVVNMTDKEITGQAELKLFDAATNEPVDGRFMNVIPQQYFTIAAGQSETLRFPMEVPYLYDDALVWRIVAKAGAHSDGEENSLPVLSNRTLVTESLPVSMKGDGTADFKFEKLINAGSSETLTQQSLTVEYTSNPVWLAVQSLPYLMEYPYDCAEQTWNRYYANTLASMIASSSPRLKAVFDKWAAGGDSATLVSNLFKNEELKSVLAAETPWLLQAKTETEQRKHIADLFNLVKMSAELDKSLGKLKEKQSSNGGFVWFSGGPDDRYITQYIVSGIGHLIRLNAVSAKQKTQLQDILNNAIPYLDKKAREDYDRLIKDKTDLKKYTPGSLQVQYLYMRSFFPEITMAKGPKTAYDYFMSRLPLAWKDQSKYMQGMTALVLHRKGDKQTPAAILKSLKETSVVNTELGRYWKDTNRGWWWYEAPLERQALLIEAFQEAGADQPTTDELKTWLVRNKQTNNWESTKATAEACYALLLQGSKWIESNTTVQVQLGNKVIAATAGKEEAGTGYFREKLDGPQVLPSMGNIKITTSGTPNSTQPSWGAVYWQYFEDLDKITSAATPLKLDKKLFIRRNTDRGPQLVAVGENETLKVGDQLTVRIELRVDREMEYVHLKDMRAAGLEPVNVLSGYRYQGGLGYYESTRDASTNFFISHLNRGTYVFEYNLFVTHKGEFSNGIASIQCMYAPEFSAHSDGIRISVE
ncbi:MAG: alpha-2-macroglobulin [Chitinophagaceae bacterium]|nr:MAG: alpha-2-macroglobulin [Chitinophagaceae bacterium]